MKGSDQSFAAAVASQRLQRALYRGQEFNRGAPSSPDPDNKIESDRHTDTDDKDEWLDGPVLQLGLLCALPDGQQLERHTRSYARCATQLDLRGGTFLTLPDDLVTSLQVLTSLEKVNLAGCHRLETLPLLPTRLRALVLRGCAALRSLPDSIGTLTGLTRLDLRGCVSLTSLPDVGRLQSLAILVIADCTR